MKAVQRMIKKQLAGLPDGRELRGTDGLFTELDEFYHGDFMEVIAEALIPVVRSYAREIYTQAALEVGYPPEFTPDLEEFIKGYVAVSALDLELAEWLEKRAARMAKRQTTEGNGAFSKFAYIAGGVISLRWVTAGTATCPFCKKLNGRSTLVSGNFLEAGTAFDSEEGKLKVPSNVGHPPAHPGCDCYISPVGG